MKNKIFKITGLIVLLALLGVEMLDAVIPASERAALIAFYNTADGNCWKCRQGWKTPPLHSDGFATPGTEGSWFGVTVQGEHVVKLVYTGNYLKGQLNAGIENLTELTELDLRYNELSGPIPPQLGNLSKLEQLYLTGNFFSGSLPVALGRLTQLTHLLIGNNLLRGGLPPELGNCVNLERLWLENNIIWSSFPSSFARLTRLKTLNLSNNRIYNSLPAFIGALAALEVIELSNNDLSGEIPSALGALSHLRTLKIGNNKLSGLIPDSLLQLTALTDLDIKTNCLTTNNDEVITWLNALDPDWKYSQTQCNETYSYCRLLSPVGFETWRAGSVQTIYWRQFNSNSIKIEYSTDNGASWKLIAESQSDVGAYQWTVPNTPSSQCKVRITPGYNIVSANNFIIYNGAPRHERNALIALYNSTIGAGWKNKTGWKTAPLFTDGFAMPGTEGGWYGVIVRDNHVYELQFQENNLTGPIPRAIENLTNLRYFIIHYNNLNGGIPAEIGGLSQLKDIELESNNLSGPLPVVLGGLKNLEQLCLSKNQLSGAIPPELGDCSNLYDVLLDANQLSGSIPASFSKLSNLTRLCLQNNQLSGVIPAGLGQLTDMSILWLNNNLLSGEIPTSLANLKEMTRLDISANCLFAPANAALRFWLNSHDPDWESTQTKCSSITPKITLTSPNGGEIWIKGSIRAITWTSLNTVADVKIIYTYDNGLSWNSIAELAPNTGSYSWTVPNTPSSQCRVWIMEASDEIPNDISDGLFTILEGYPSIQLSQSSLNFSGLKSGAATGAQNIWLTNNGKGVLNWKASSNSPWLFVSPGSGNGGAILSITVNHTGMAPGTYSGAITVTDPIAFNSPRVVNVRLDIKNSSQDAPAFGDFATPINLSTVRSSVPFTGWTLDDIGVESVKIYREEGKSMIYIGEAAFVEGARPDVEAAFPEYPNKYKAGWGYMMLTCFLPGGGNGVFRFHAIAKEVSGKTVDLGVKTITVDNAHAVKPFGAIDTPTQGGFASGPRFVNWGWALTPPPNTIPTDGSTIQVWVDGVSLGNPSYNNYRPDIAALFPQYANKNGASGYAFLDASSLKSGVHSLQWTAVDNAGNSDGIGSRYFSVLNPYVSSANTPDAALAAGSPSLRSLAPDILPVSIQTGFTPTPPREIAPDDQGIIHVALRELEPLVIGLAGTLPPQKDNRRNTSPYNDPEPGYPRFSGYLCCGDDLRPLPPGTTLDEKKGIFYWRPGPGFTGPYSFLFTANDETGAATRKEIIITIEPKHPLEPDKH